MHSRSRLSWLVGLFGCWLAAAQGNSSSGGVPNPILPGVPDVPAAWQAFNDFEVVSPVTVARGAKVVALPTSAGVQEGCRLEIADGAKRDHLYRAGDKLGISSVSWDLILPHPLPLHGPFDAPRMAPARPGPVMPPPQMQALVKGVRFVLEADETMSLVCPWTKDTPKEKLEELLSPALVPQITPMPPSTTQGMNENRGLADPGAIAIEGNRLYVSEMRNQTENKIAVLALDEAGLGRKLGEIATPVNPVDILVADGTLYLVDNRQHDLYWARLTTQNPEWHRIALSSALDGDYANGKVLYRAGDELFVIHARQPSLDVVNLKTKRIDRVLNETGLDPLEVVFADGAAFVISHQGAIFHLDLKYLSLEAWRPATPNRYLSAAGVPGALYLATENSVERYDLESRQVTERLYVHSLSNSMGATERGVFVTTYDGRLLELSADLAEVTRSFALLTQPKLWSPPLEKILVRPRGSDTEVIVSNLNDGGINHIAIPAAIRP